MASNKESMIKRGFQSNKPRMRVMKRPEIFHFRIPEPEEYDLMDEDESASGFESCSEVKLCSPCDASSSPMEGSNTGPQYDAFESDSSALQSIRGSSSTHKNDDSSSTHHQDDDDEQESQELDEINSPQSEFGPSYSSPSYATSPEPLSPPRCASYFDCNLCLKMAREPAVNSCGHLFCGICFQNWLQIFCLDHPECPVCKSEVSPSSITLILQSASASSETPVGHGDLSSGFSAPSPPGPKKGLCFED
ncbi:hypothetical protein CerSpe_078900 [Prunus speciosa]